MSRKKIWSDKYPLENDAEFKELRNHKELDAYVAATQARESVSAHAWQLYPRGDTHNAIIPIQSKHSADKSTQERGCLSAAVRILQHSKKDSHIRMFFRLENAVKGLRGEHVLRENSDILEEYEAQKERKSIDVEPIQVKSTEKDRNRIVERLLMEARKTRDLGLEAGTRK